MSDFTRDEFAEVLDTTEKMHAVLERPIRRVPTLRGTTIANVFYEPSTRTRVSFELAGKNLSADVVNVAASGSSVEKGESLIDTFQTIQALGADIVVVRHSRAGAPELASRHLTCGVINAGDGARGHPTQALLDLYTVQRRLGSVEGRTIVIVGDILHSRVARSGIWAFARMGAQVVLSGPPSLLPDTMAAITNGTGEVRIVHTKSSRVIVTGANMVKKHRRSQDPTTPSGIIDIEAPLHVSNVRLVCPSCDAAVRVGFRILDEGRKVRFCKSCGEAVD